MNHTRLAFDRLTLASQFVELLPIYLLGRKHRRRLVLVTHKSRHLFFDIRLCQLRHRLRLNDLAIGILRISRFTKLHGASVFLIHAHQKLRDLGRLTDEDQQQACRHWIERAGMTNLLNPKHAAHARNDIVGSHPLWLINQQYADWIIINWLRHRKYIFEKLLWLAESCEMLAQCLDQFRIELFDRTILHIQTSRAGVTATIEQLCDLIDSVERVLRAQAAF